VIKSADIEQRAEGDVARVLAGRKLGVIKLVVFLDQELIIRGFKLYLR
jgi:hypothetical protein